MAIFATGSCFPAARYMTESSAKIAIEITIGNTNDIDLEDIANQRLSESNKSFDKVCRTLPASL